MNVLKILVGGVLPLVLSAAVLAQPRESVEGVHYVVLNPPVPTASPADRIEMKELFWYGCPQCAELEPLTTGWRDGIAGDLDFRRAPAIWNEVMETHARLYYVAEALRVLDRVHVAAFQAIHAEGKPLSDEAQVREFLERFGVNAEEFARAWNSDEVNEKVEAARAATAAYGVEKLPSLVINGGYRVAQSHATPDHMEMMVAVNLVIRKIRSERRIDLN